MELWAAGIALLIIAAGILVLILCGKKIHKGLQIAGVCVLGALFAAILGYIVLTFLFMDALDSPSMDEPTVSRTVLSEEQATLHQLNFPVCTSDSREENFLVQYLPVSFFGFYCRRQAAYPITFSICRIHLTKIPP